MTKKAAKKVTKKAAAKKPAKIKTTKPARKGKPVAAQSGYGGQTPLLAVAQAVPHGALYPSELNPRKVIEMEPVKALAESIVVEGILQSLLVRPGTKGKYEIISGERRWRAVDLAIRDGRLPEAYPMPVRVRPCSDAELVELAATENMARDDMSPIDEADVIAAMRRYHKDDVEIARRLGIPERTLYRRVQLLKLIPVVRQALTDDKINLAQAQAFSCGSDKAQAEHWQYLNEGDQADLREAGVWDARPENIRNAMTEDMISTEQALFPLELYKGEIVEGDGENFFADTAQFKRLQGEAVKERVADLKTKWSWCRRIDSGEQFQYDKVAKTDEAAGAVYWVNHQGGLEVKAPVLSAEETKKRNKTKHKDQVATSRNEDAARQKLISRLAVELVAQPALVLAHEIASEITNSNWDADVGADDEEIKREELILDALFAAIGPGIGAKKRDKIRDVLQADPDQLEPKLVAACVDLNIPDLVTLIVTLQAGNWANRMVRHNGEIGEDGLKILQRYLPGFEPAGLKDAAE